MHAVFLDQQTFSQSINLSAIEHSVTSLQIYQLTCAEQLIERCQGADIIISNKVILNADTLSHLPQLKLICIAATGTNNVDITAAKNLGIAVTNVSGYAQGSVAQYVFAQMLSYFSQTEHHNENCRQGLWQQSETFCLHGNGSVELSGKTLGLIGYGSLGEAVANLAQAFGMKVLVAERQQVISIRTGRTNFEQVIQESDVLSLHCPQTEETTGLVDQALLAQMKPSAMLINTARGGIINNNDLHHALSTNQIAFAVLDVLDQEPPPADHLFFSKPLDNLKITAHIAWASIEAQQRLVDLLAKNISAFNQDKKLNRLDI